MPSAQSHRPSADMPGSPHYRDKDQVEVDFVLEDSLRQVIGVEVKAAAQVSPQDFKGLKRFVSAGGQRLHHWHRAVRRHHVPLPFGNGLRAIPSALLKP